MSEDKIKPTHGVFYTDGGCDNPTVAGWGIHGYLFVPEPAKQGTGNPKALPTALGYQMGGSGKPDITLTHYVDGFGSLTSHATNNVAELMANYKTLELIKQTGLKEVTLLMDSEYVLNGFEKWIHEWQKNGWTRKGGQAVSNGELWKKVYNLKIELKEDGVNFTSKWVRGHNGDLGNERADSLATAGKMAARNQNPLESFKIADAKGFWNPKSKRNRMFSLPNWYFAAYGSKAPEGPNDSHVYYIGTVRDDIELIGKAIADASFAVLFLKESDPALEVVRQGTEDMYVGRPQGVMVGYLDQIFRSATYEELLDYGRNLLIKDRRNRRLMTKDKKLILHEADPPGLSFRLMEHMGLLEDRLRDFIKSHPKSHLRKTDITGLIYEKTEGKKKTSVKLKSSITTGTRSMKVEGIHRDEHDGSDRSLTFVLTLAQDLPDRNTLAALASEDVKVTLVTWPESVHAVRFAVVVESNGDVGIWAGPYSNLQMLPFKKPT